MTLPSFSATLGTPSTTPMPALADGPLADGAGAGATTDAAPGGFAAMLDEAAASLDALAVNVLEGAMPVLQALPEVPVPTLPAAAAIANALPTALPTALSALDASAVAAAPSDAGLDAAGPAPGWPPPGLSSLFPGSPVLAAQVGAQAAASTLASARGFALGALLPEGVDARLPDSTSPSSATGLALDKGVVSTMAAAAAAMPMPQVNAAGPDALAAPLSRQPGPLRLPDSTSPSSATGLALDKGVASTMAAATAMPMPQANAAGPDALAAALARQPAPLRLPVADESDASSLTALTETLGLERAPDAAPLAPTSPAPALHKLDLAQAFPAPVPLPSPRFAEDVGARVQWIAEQQGGEATLRISPDGLGPVEIRLKLDGDRVELGFTATQLDTRQALQDALPKLREMLAQQGLQLGHADVGQKHAQSSNDDAAKTAKGFASDDEGEAIVIAGTQRESNVIAGRVGRGMLDLYA